MYTAQPLIDLTNSHVGFWAALVLVVLILGFLHSTVLDELWEYTYAYLLTILILGFVYSQSYSPNQISPTNEKVVADFVQFVPQYEITGGKSKTVTNTMYVIYSTPDGLVPIKFKEGAVAHKQVILYKN